MRYEAPSVDPVVTLRSKEPSVPLPNPEYLRVHFQVAEILDVSGINKKIDDAWEKEAWDPENIEPDGLYRYRFYPMS